MGTVPQFRDIVVVKGVSPVPCSPFSPLSLFFFFFACTYTLTGACLSCVLPVQSACVAFADGAAVFDSLLVVRNVCLAIKDVYSNVTIQE